MAADSRNLLHNEVSSYLLQHADNPVHWRPWGPEAFAAAEERDCPILLSIGYAACHWCHVMAHESFEDPTTATVMNRLFVNIKVDREERPDIDHIYMSALHALGEQGGWPLTIFLSPDGRPFWGGTYFPPTERFGRPSFHRVLHAMADAWNEKRDAIDRNLAAVEGALVAMSAATPGEMPTPLTLEQVATALLKMVDQENGGLRGAPKFPNQPVFRFLWQHAFCRGKNTASLNAVHHLLRAMSLGGIYDHLGGGYARYSTDAEWLAPHFEKMLYDNAQVLDLLTLAYSLKADPLYSTRAAETVEWLNRDMSAASNEAGHAAFAASEDADSDGEEGRFYVWSDEEITAALGPVAASFKTAYDVTVNGNWEGKTILRRVTPFGDTAAESALAVARARLFHLRARRIRPACDDKVLADWNGLAIAAMCRAAIVFDRPDWLQRAANAYRFLMETMHAADGRMQHSWRRGRITAAGLLDDQAGVARAALALFEAVGEPAYLETAIVLADAAEKWFADADGSFFTSAIDAVDVPTGRPRTAADNATPSGNGVMAEVLARLYHLTGEGQWRNRAERVISAFSGARTGLATMPCLLAACELLENATLIVICGPKDDVATNSLVRAALCAPNPATVVLRAPDPCNLPRLHPAYGKPALPPAAYVCRGSVCGLPEQDPDALQNTVRQAA